MKTIIVSMIQLTMVMTSMAQAPTPKPTNQVLFDFRNQRPITSPRIPAASERYVLSKLFRRYLTDEKQCNADFQSNGNDPLRAARVAGQIVPSIVDSATGSFTAAGQLETAYVISVSECNASHADNFGTKRVAIFSGQRLIADMDADFRTSIVRKTDLNKDGIDELLMTSGDMNQGILMEIGALVGFQNGRLKVIQDFGTVTEDSCAAAMSDSSSKASLLTFTEAAFGSMPRVKVENYESSCRKAKRWRLSH